MAVPLAIHDLIDIWYGLDLNPNILTTTKDPHRGCLPWFETNFHSSKYNHNQIGGMSSICFTNGPIADFFNLGHYTFQPYVEPTGGG